MASAEERIELLTIKNFRLEERIELLTKALKKSEKKAYSLQRTCDIIRAVLGCEIPKEGGDRHE